MEKMKELKRIFEEERPGDWNSIPDIDLYMDQVISYMKRQHLGFHLDESLTSAMVNNYVKQELLPRAKGKKYNREHIAYLTAICLFKQVLDLPGTKTIMDSQLGNAGIQDFYRKYTELLDKELMNVDQQIDEEMDDAQISDLALKLAVSSYTEKLACQFLLKAMEKPVIKEKKAGKTERGK